MTCVVKMDAPAAKLRKEQRKKRMTPGHALKASLRQAATQKRLTVGLDCSVTKLKRSPDSVMACLLLQHNNANSSHREGSKVKDKVAHKIQHTLLQAFCVENHITLIHVVADASLMKLAGRLGGKVEKDVEFDSPTVQMPTTDCSVLLIEHPEGALSPEDSVWSAACHGGRLDVAACGHLPSD